MSLEKPTLSLRCASLERVLDLARTLPTAELPVFIGELETVRVTALARITTPHIESQRDENLDVAEAARRLGVSKGYLYHAWPRLPFARHEGRRLLFRAQAWRRMSAKPAVRWICPESLIALLTGRKMSAYTLGWR
jgi:hypothetical protein